MVSVYTSTQLTSDSGDRHGVKPSLIVLHHTAFTGSIQSLVNLMMPGGRTVSAHAAIKDGQIINVVPESRRSFSLGAAVFERRVLSAECVNSTGGPSWSLSDATHESIARWVADVCKRHGIRPHREGPPSSWTVIGHREVSTIHQAGYGTACPGGMRVDWIVDRAKQLLARVVPAQVVTVQALPAAVAPGLPVPLRKLIAKVGPNMKCMILGNLKTGSVAFLVLGGEPYLFASAAEYNNFRTVINTHNSLPFTPDEWKWPNIPELQRDTILFVNDEQWTVTVKAVSHG